MSHFPVIFFLSIQQESSGVLDFVYLVTFDHILNRDNPSQNSVAASLF